MLNVLDVVLKGNGPIKREERVTTNVLDVVPSANGPIKREERMTLNVLDVVPSVNGPTRLVLMLIRSANSAAKANGLAKLVLS